MFSGSFISSGEKLLNWINKRHRSEEGFNDKEQFLQIYVSLLLLVKQSSETEFAKDNKFLFIDVPN